MARAAVLAALVTLAPALPEGCAKVLGKGHAAQPNPSAQPRPQPQPVAVPTPSATATTPPVWTPPDPGGPLPTPAPPASASELSDAQTASHAGDHKKVRALLEKKVKSGKASHEEATLLMEACLILRDKACVRAVKAKHPDVEGP